MRLPSIVMAGLAWHLLETVIQAVAKPSLANYTNAATPNSRYIGQHPSWGQGYFTSADSSMGPAIYFASSDSPQHDDRSRLDETRVSSPRTNRELNSSQSSDHTITCILSGPTQPNPE
ncbi:hypothetical protein PC9H_008307 [Pleurotus ostreatus]|uniref:Uncharacterized protein n=1 Tax=Pleurotus ostreatus TaxID=5322 RepID=A0A8H6ZNH5_PLEOS|nr:uncharacterized protein PC9H_008307 [Pleurotus ostreatus]KAF7425945.1 hypothetical protein PC9H_008307 [Pleurotus ostreatus]